MASELAVSAELAEQEAVIEKNIEGFYAVGQALTRIRDEKLYVGQYKSFKDYCNERWEFSRSRAYQLMNAVVTVDKIKALDGATSAKVSSVSTMVDTDEGEPESYPRALPGGNPAIPGNERQARKAAAEIEEKPAESNGKPEPPRDPNGARIPANLKPILDAADEYQAIIGALGKIRGQLDGMAKRPDGVFLAERMTRLSADLTNAQREVRSAKPYQVCPYCSGKGCKPDKAGNKAPCRGTGWTPKGVAGAGK